MILCIFENKYSVIIIWLLLFLIGTYTCIVRPFSIASKHELSTVNLQIEEYIQENSIVPPGAAEINESIEVYMQKGAITHKDIYGEEYEQIVNSGKSIFLSKFQEEIILPIIIFSIMQLILLKLLRKKVKLNVFLLNAPLLLAGFILMQPLFIIPFIFALVIASANSTH